MKYIDLSYSISSNFQTYPSDPDIEITKEKDIEKDRTVVHSIKLGTHTGSHVDVPAHIIAGGKTLKDYPLNFFTGKAIKINSSSIDEINNLDENIDGVIFETGWYKNFIEPQKFYGKKRPVLKEEHIKILLKKKINFFGCDLPSVDISGSKEKPIHNLLLSNDVLIYESLNNLNELPLHKIFEFYGFPLNFPDLDASPVRAVCKIA